MFRKRSSDFEVLDIPLLQKRGILKVSPAKSDMIDFTSPTAQAQPNPLNSTLLNSASPDNPFGMLDAFSQLGAGTLSSAQSSATNLSGASNTSSNSEVSALKIKIDDLEYKLERLLDRIAQIDSKMNVLGR